VPRVGAEVGVAAPVNEVIAAIVRAKETLFPAQGR
jgi:ketopantoate reductase